MRSLEAVATRDTEAMGEFAFCAAEADRQLFEATDYDGAKATALRLVRTLAHGVQISQKVHTLTRR